VEGIYSGRRYLGGIEELGKYKKVSRRI